MLVTSIPLSFSNPKSAYEISYDHSKSKSLLNFKIEDVLVPLLIYDAPIYPSSTSSSLYKLPLPFKLPITFNLK